MTALSNDVIRATALHYNKAKGNITEAAKAAGITRPTFASRLEVGRQRSPQFFQSFEPAQGGNSQMGNDMLARMWNAFVVHKFDRIAAAASVGVNHSTFTKRVQRYAQLHKIDLQKLCEPATVEDHVSAYRSSEAQQSSRAKLKEAIGTIAGLQERIKELEWTANASYEPAAWSLPVRTPRKREHMPYLFTSDFQIGEVIQAEETEAGYGFDSEIFRRRYRRMIATTIYLSFEHVGKDWKFPGIIYVRGGDTISGGIHEELRDTDDLTPIEAVECAFEEESAGIAKLADAFGKVDVKAPGAAGNHDRTTFKPRTKTVSAHSYDRLIGGMLRRHFSTDKRVTFQVSQSFDVRFPIYKRNILVTHGDRIGSSGGQGFIGPIATILRGWQKILMEQTTLGFPVDEVHSGHFHTPFWTPWGWSNGCMPGYSEFAKQYRMRPTPPMQLFGYYHPTRGVVDMKPITLTEA